MGFTGESTLPVVVGPSIVKVLIEMATRYPKDIWATSLRVFGMDNTLLCQTPVGIIYKEAGGISHSCEIGCHDPPSRALGVQIRWCGNKDCNAIDSVYFKNSTNGSGEQLRLKCIGCGFVSQWVSTSDVTWANAVPGTRRSSWHEYPLTPNQLMIFVGQTKKRKAIAGESERPHRMDVQ